MPWQTTGSSLDPSTNTYVAAYDGDAIFLQGSDAAGPLDVGLTFTDQRARFTASLGFANAPNAWMQGLSPGDVVLMARNGRVHLGGGEATTTPQLMVCEANKSAPSQEGGPAYQRDGIYVRDSVNFTADPTMHTGECVRSERGSNPNQYGLDLYTNDAARLSITQDGHVGIGTQTPGAALDVVGDIRVSGDVFLTNADCAEDFASAGALEPGTVVVFDDSGRICHSAEAYDSRVAGVVSGAGELRPAIRLNHSEEPSNPRVPLALVGRVMCNVDADRSPIAVGDLLTTSATLGHAMKATDRQRAFGAILGKALGRLSAGRGLIPVLVALQ